MRKDATENEWTPKKSTVAVMPVAGSQCNIYSIWNVRFQHFNCCTIASMSIVIQHIVENKLCDECRDQ